jgi:hypothetical protein
MPAVYPVIKNSREIPAASNTMDYRFGLALVKLQKFINVN